MPEKANQFMMQLSGFIAQTRMKANCPATRPVDSHDLHCVLSGAEHAMDLAFDVFGAPEIQMPIPDVDALDDGDEVVVGGGAVVLP